MSRVLQSIVKFSLILMTASAPEALVSQKSTTPSPCLGTHIEGGLPCGVFTGKEFLAPEAFAATMLAIPRATITGKPVSLTKQSRSVFRNFDGTRTTTLDTIEWERDSEGRERLDVDREISESDGQLHTSYTIITDPIEREYLTIDSTRRVINVVHFPAASSVKPPIDAAHEQGQNSQMLGSKLILGITAEGTRTVKTAKMVASSDGRLVDVPVTIDSWWSPALSIELESDWTYANWGTIKMKTLKIDQNEPDSSLFELPKGYRVIEGRWPAQKPQ